MPHILLIADATESAASCWPQTTRAIADLLASLPAGAVAGVALLGTNLMWPVEAWRPDLPLPPEAAATGSLVSPVMAGIRARGLAPRWAVIAGSGEVFDLADWERGRATNAPGQSGQPGSPYYDNLVESWDKGRYFPLAFSRARVEEVAAHRLVLLPARP